METWFRRSFGPGMWALAGILLTIAQMLAVYAFL